MSTEQNKQTIARIYAALENGDLSVYGENLHDDYVWRAAGHSSWSKRFEGRETVQRDLMRPLFALFATRYTARVISLIGEGDTVVAEVQGDVVTKSGERYDNQYCFIFRFRDGKIAEIIEYADTALEERVLGRYEDVVAAWRATA